MIIFIIFIGSASGKRILGAGRRYEGKKTVSTKYKSSENNTANFRSANRNPYSTTK